MAIYGEVWSSGTLYYKGDYVYSNKVPGVLFLAQNNGYSHPSEAGRSGSVEPAWAFDLPVQDKTIIWKSVKASGTELKWCPGTMYSVGKQVVPTSGPIYWGDVPYSFRASRFLLEPDWKRVPDSITQDNEVLWRTLLSTSFFLPKARLKETAFIEFYKLLDYLMLSEDIYLQEVVHKFNDRNQLSTDTLRSFVSERGYSYIMDALVLDDSDLKNLITYIGAINMLKGSKQGLTLIFDLLNVTYKIEEWWESYTLVKKSVEEEEPFTPINIVKSARNANILKSASPLLAAVTSSSNDEEYVYTKGVSDTWSLYCEVDANKATNNLSTKLYNMARDYVYPTLANYEISYKADMFTLQASMAGVTDKELIIPVGPGWWCPITMAGFVDKEISWKDSVWKYSINPISVILYCGNVDANYTIKLDGVKHPILPPVSPTQMRVQISTDKDFTSLISDEIVPYDTKVKFQDSYNSCWVRINCFDETYSWTGWSNAIHYYIVCGIEAPTVLEPEDGTNYIYHI